MGQERGYEVAGDNEAMMIDPVRERSVGEHAKRGQLKRVGVGQGAR